MLSKFCGRSTYGNHCIVNNGCHQCGLPDYDVWDGRL